MQKDTYKIINIHRGSAEKGREKILYAELEVNGVVVICATLEYILFRLKDRYFIGVEFTA
jgi:hypothetical protein